MACGMMILNMFSWGRHHDGNNNKISQVIVLIIATVTILYSLSSSSCLVDGSSAASAPSYKVYHPFQKYLKTRRGCTTNMNQSGSGKRNGMSGNDMINIWNLRSLGSLQLTSPPPPVSLASSSSSQSINLYNQRRCHRRGYTPDNTDNVNNNMNESGSHLANSRVARRRITAPKIVRQDGQQCVQQMRNSRSYSADQEDFLTAQTPQSLEEMRAQLGPIGKLIANSVEVGVTTAGSYLSGGLFGYIIGGATGLPILFQDSSKHNFPDPSSTTSIASSANHNFLPSKNAFQEGQRRLGFFHNKALTQAKSWGQLSAAFSGFHALTRVCRGGVEDRWNGIIGSFCTGAYLNRAMGPQAMLQGGTTYASFTYILDFAFGGSGRRSNGAAGGGEMDYYDTDIETSGL
mmetsp:Transcript_18650/g.26266  ORF Transcript_18650/g.26266 Transcript_18650/m.26266 type:complete len:403 (+) Transcript_18650:70-1278(+)